jgi:hypothetical protein
MPKLGSTETGITYITTFICECGEDVGDEDITYIVQSHIWDKSTDVVICMNWHRGCYLRRIRGAATRRLQEK